MATFVWLCGFDPRTLRSTDLPDTLVEAPYLHQRLSLAGVPTLPATDVGRCHRSGNAFAIYGLLRVRRGTAWSGSLTQWQSAGHVQHKFLGCPSDAYSIVVEQAYPFQQPLAVYTQQVRRGNRYVELNIEMRCRSMVFWPTAEASLLRQVVAVPDTEVVAAPDMAAILRDANWRESIQAIQVAMPLVHGIMSGHVQDIVLLARWPRLWPDFPIPLQATQPPRVETDVTCSPAFWQEMLATLRQCAPALRAQMGEEGCKPLADMAERLECVWSSELPLFLMHYS
jgi:hypothetical protein